jgi:transcriptional regulator with XRE-family HTH domain
MPRAPASEDRRQTRRRPNTKLTEEDVVAIREQLAVGIKQAELARRYGVTRQYISLIANEMSWVPLSKRAVTGRHAEKP